MKQWQHLRGKAVVVVASGVTYRGTVVELGLAALLLKAPSGFREIAWECILRIEEVSGAGGSRPAAPSALRR